MLSGPSSMLRAEMCLTLGLRRSFVNLDITIRQMSLEPLDDHGVDHVAVAFVGGVVASCLVWTTSRLGPPARS